MLTLSAILVVSLSLSSLADASAIKGGSSRPNAEAESRSIKMVPQADKLAPKSQAPVAILESTKRIFNDESIRRLVIPASPLALVESQAQAKHSVVPVEQQASPASPIIQKEPVAPVVPVVEPVKPVVEQQHPVVQAEPVVAAPVAPVVPVVSAAQPVVPVEPVQPVAAPVIEPAKPVAAPVVVVKQEEPLPPQSDRSASQVPVVQSVVIPEQVVRVAEQQSAPVVSGQPIEPVVAVVAPVVPVVPAEQPAPESQLMAKKDEPAISPDAPIEVPAPDPGLILSEPIDSTTKLLIDLDEHVQKFLPAEEQAAPAQPPKEQVLVPGVDYSPAGPQVARAPAEPTGKSSGPLSPYSIVVAGAAEEAIVPPLPSLDGVEKASAGGPQVAHAAPNASSSPAAGSVSVSSSGSASGSPPHASAARQGGQNHQNQQQVITQLLDQLDTLQNRIQDTINQLVARRRYVMSALLRPMGTYVRRVRTNLERLQNRVNQLQNAAMSVGGGQNRPGGFVDPAAIEAIRRRIDDISKRISDIVNRIRFSLTPTSAPMNGSNGRK